jgi:transcriptional regulator with XRE-family HTH domain
MHLMMRVVSFAEIIRIVPRSNEAGTSIEVFNTALDGLAKMGIGRQLRPLSAKAKPSQVTEASSAILEAVEESPLPEQEWMPLAEILGEAELAQLLNISDSSISRYKSGERSTPDAVASRLHFLAIILADLAGSYNEFGMRRWFLRSRTALDDHSPKDILSGDWDPDQDGPQRVRSLAHSLLGAALG